MFMPAPEENSGALEEKRNHACKEGFRLSEEMPKGRTSTETHPARVRLRYGHASFSGGRCVLKTYNRSGVADNSSEVGRNLIEVAHNLKEVGRNLNEVGHNLSEVALNFA